ncbi:alpha/beta hydrolase [Mycolicibacterium sp. P1-18]|uniref:alpha/beta fold hydrolase n=1 Tax=Mycolicibacterium sp. P1-18 TaxID=2024615 RepID=UPI0011F13276|nr:alpha/beta hydrolase [Mycolicibacterium sp. P1-18]KAA0100753.1 alpha/beta hydrolase [Mycolicibacterium sp. P1-18]
MTTFLLVPGGGCDPSCWRFVVDELARRGHRGIAVDLPCEDDTADLDAYADAVVAAHRDDGEPPVVVAHSFGGFTGALACTRVGASALVYASAMIPRPGERPADWWAATECLAAQRAAASAGGYDLDDDNELYYNGVDASVVAAEVPRGQSSTPTVAPWPAPELPPVTTRFVLFADDRFFPADFMRGVVADRLGVEPEVTPGGHMAMLSHPVELTDRILAQT